MLKFSRAFPIIVWVLFFVCGFYRPAPAGCVCEGTCYCEDGDLLLQGNYHILSACSIADVCEVVCATTGSGAVQDTDGSCVENAAETTITTTRASTTSTTVPADTTSAPATTTAGNPGATTSVPDNGTATSTVTVPPDFAVDITAPADNDSFARDECIRFEGAVIPSGSPAPADEALAWTSSEAGPIGRGPSFLRCDLVPGEHVITLTAEDSEGLQASDAVNIHISTERSEDAGEDACAAVTILGEGHPGLNTLRHFRDTVLAQSASGRKLIRAYERSAPALVDILEGHPALRLTARRVLEAALPALEQAVE